jgi:hypothetical protein
VANDQQRLGGAVVADEIHVAGGVGDVELVREDDFERAGHAFADGIPGLAGAPR